MVSSKQSKIYKQWNLFLLLFSSLLQIVGCSPEQSRNTSDDQVVIKQSPYYDRNNEHQFVDPIWDSADYYAADLCNCIAKELNSLGYNTKRIIDNYDGAMNTVYAVGESESVFCGYWAEWKDIYNRRELDSLMTNYVLVKGEPVATVRFHS